MNFSQLGFSQFTWSCFNWIQFKKYSIKKNQENTIQKMIQFKIFKENSIQKIITSVRSSRVHHGLWHTSNCQLIVWYIFYCWRLNFLWTNFWFLPNSKKVRETWAPYTYGPTLKNFTLIFLPLNMYWKSPRKF